MLLIAGIITYVGVMEKAGTVNYVANGISSLGMPLLVALLLCFTGAIVSAFASSTALLGAIIPLAFQSCCRADQRRRRGRGNRDFDDDRRHQPVFHQWRARRRQCAG